ncbi:hypothetical protein MTO96_033823 [Rhipicephalus appendiculatus]
MALVVPIRSAIIAATILQAVFIRLSRPDSTSIQTTTAQPNITADMCNQTCNSTCETPCSNEACFCVTKNNDTIAVSSLVMALGKSIMVALVLLIPSLISHCTIMANSQIDGGGIGTCNQNCTFYNNGTSSPCNGNSSCISDSYDFLGSPQNPVRPGKCYETHSSSNVAKRNL